MGDAAGKAYWNNVWASTTGALAYEGPVFEQHPVLRRFLTGTGGEAIEVGCVPGTWLLYVNKEYGYRVSGVDYSEHLPAVAATLRHNGIEDFELFHDDLFRFEPGKRYDLVFSSGFVEHFDDHELVVRRHADLAKPGGLVVIMVPNLTHLHRWLCGWFHPEILRVHRFPLMRQAVLRASLERAGLEVLHCAYHKTFRPVYTLPKVLDWISRALQKALRMARMDQMGNRFGSPYLISVSRKRLPGGAPSACG